MYSLNVILCDVFLRGAVNDWDMMDDYLQPVKMTVAGRGRAELQSVNVIDRGGLRGSGELRFINRPPGKSVQSDDPAGVCL